MSATSPHTPQSLGYQRNKLYRYEMILKEYLEHKTEDIPLMVIYRKYIYPKFGISRSTLYTVLETPIKKEQQKVKDIQLSLFG